jgi:hypothetical protein
LFSADSVWSAEERWSFEKQQKTLSALQKETVARAFGMALSFTKARPYIVGSSNPSTPALEEEKGAMAKELYTQTPRVEASKISYSVGLRAHGLESAATR